MKPPLSTQILSKPIWVSSYAAMRDLNNHGVSVTQLTAAQAGVTLRQVAPPVMGRCNQQAPAPALHALLVGLCGLQAASHVTNQDGALLLVSRLCNVLKEVRVQLRTLRTRGMTWPQQVDTGMLSPWWKDRAEWHMYVVLALTLNTPKNAKPALRINFLKSQPVMAL